MTLTELLEELKIEYRQRGEHHHATESWINIDCPFCSPNSGKFRLGIHAKKLFGNCWHCGAHKLRETLYEYAPTLRLSRIACNKLLHNLDTMYVSQIKSHSRQQICKLPLPLFNLTRFWRRKLRDRYKIVNIDTATKLWSLKCTKHHQRVPHSLFIPIHFHGEIVSWTTRRKHEHSPRFVSAHKTEESIPAKTLLFGEDYARNAIVIVESPLDAVCIGPGAVATFGVSYTQFQTQKMSYYPLRVVCFDTDKAGKTASEKLCTDLSAFAGETVQVFLQTGKDACSASYREIESLRKNFLQ